MRLLADILSGGGPRSRVRAAQGRAEALALPEDFPLPVALEFLTVYENERSAPYFPIEGIGGVAYASDGTLYFCDEKGGRVHGLDPAGDWFQFDGPGRRFFRPVDLRVDGFNVLVLDMDGQVLLRYEMGGAYLDRLATFAYIDPGYDRLPSAFDVDVDGRMAFTDVSEQQTLLVDAFLQLDLTLGEPGSHREQFRDPSGVAFLPDGGFVVADRGNRRLQRYNRLGYFLGVVGGEFDPQNPMITPQGLDADVDGNVFVADPAAGAVHVYDPAMGYLFSLGSELGLLASPESPIDVAVGPDDLLAVTDRGRQAVLVYRIVYE